MACAGSTHKLQEMYGCHLFDISTIGIGMHSSAAHHCLYQLSTSDGAAASCKLLVACSEMASVAVGTSAVHDTTKHHAPRGTEREGSMSGVCACCGMCS